MEFKKHKILIAEDNAFNMLYLTEVLRPFNLDILQAENGASAIELFKLNPDIELCLLDVKMPEIDGSEVARGIKKINPAIPTIAQTAYALEQEKEEYGESFDVYLTKPVKKDLLLNTLRKYIDI